MCMALGNINLLSVADRATETLVRKENQLPTATDKNFLAVQIVYRFHNIRAKGVPDDQQY